MESIRMIRVLMIPLLLHATSGAAYTPLSLITEDPPSIVNTTMGFQPASLRRSRPLDLSRLRMGINITRWFRTPVSREPARIAEYLDDDALKEIRLRGITFVRIAISQNLIQDELGHLRPDLLKVLDDSIIKLIRADLRVILTPFFDGIDLSKPNGGALLLSFWGELAPLLSKYDQSYVYPELVNEPKISPKAWETLEALVIGKIRETLPWNWLVTSGVDWSSASALIARDPANDHMLIYSFHYYQPAEFTSHGRWNKAIDPGPLERLPFPVLDATSCRASLVADAKECSDTCRAINTYCSGAWSPRTLRQQLQPVGDWAKRQKVSVLATEFGAMADHQENYRLAYLSAVRQTLTQIGITGSSVWGYDDSFGLNIKPPDKLSSADPRVLEVLNIQ